MPATNENLKQPELGNAVSRLVYETYGINRFSVKTLNTLEILHQENNTISDRVLEDGIKEAQNLITSIRHEAREINPDDAVRLFSSLVHKIGESDDLSPFDKEALANAKAAIDEGSVRGVMADILTKLSGNPLGIKANIEQSGSVVARKDSRGAGETGQSFLDKISKTLSPQMEAVTPEGVRLKVDADPKQDILSQFNLQKAVQDNKSWGLITATVTALSFYAISVPSIVRGLNSATETSWIGVAGGIGLNAAETALIHAFAHPEFMGGLGVSEKISKYGIAGLLGAIYALDFGATLYQFSRGTVPPDQVGMVLTWSMRGLSALCAAVLPEISTEIALAMWKLRNKGSSGFAPSLSTPRPAPSLSGMPPSQSGYRRPEPSYHPVSGTNPNIPPLKKPPSIFNKK